MLSSPIFTTHLSLSDVESSIPVIELTIHASARLSLIFSRRRAFWNSNHKFDYMLDSLLDSGTAFATWLPRVRLEKKAREAGMGRKDDFGLIVYLVSHIFFGRLEDIQRSVIGANYLAFDIVGDLAFGAPFGMIKAAKDSAVVPKDQKAAMDSYGKKDSSVEVVEIPAVRILNGRGEFSMSMGVLPPWWRPFVRNLPWFAQGKKDVKTLAGIAIMAVAKRLATPTDRVDLLSKLQEGRDSEGKPMGREELTAEALTLLIAGSDTTSK